MKIHGPASPVATPSPFRSSGAASSDFALVGVSVARPAAPAGPAGSIGAVHSLDALLALQETPGPKERRRRAVKRAGKLLDVLDALKLALLDGASPMEMLARLQTAVEEERGETDDPRLQDVLDEIETRAAVELAKQEMSGAGQARAA